MQTPKIKKQAAEFVSPTVDLSKKGRRVFMRYPVELDATLTSSDGHIIQCDMKDFCMGGMLLHYSPQVAQDQVNFFKVNDKVIVQTIVPMGNGDKLAQFHARIVRVMQDGVGIAFVEPKSDALQIMQRFAQQSLPGSMQPSNLVAGGSRGSPHGWQSSEIVAGCGRAVQETMDALLSQLGGRLYQCLFDLSSSSVDIERQNSYFIAAGEIKGNQNKFIEIIRSNYKERLQAALDKTFDTQETANPGYAKISFEDLSLIGDEDLGSWLAISDVTGKVEEKYKETLTLLEERLSVLFNSKVDHANNPYGPAPFAESFQAGLIFFKFKEIVNTACFGVFKDIIITLLSDLYGKLNAILIGYGILPKLNYRMLHQSALLRRRSVPTAATVEQESFVRSQRDMPSSTFSSSPVTSMAAERAEGYAAFQDELSASSSASSPIFSKATVSIDAHAAPQNMFQVVQDLRALRQSLDRQRMELLPGPHASSASNTVITEITPDISDISKCYTTSDLVAAIADLQTNPHNFQFNDVQPNQLKSRIAAVLMLRAGEGNARILHPRDSNVLEITGDLLGTMQSDPLVAEGVKPWLRQLELPVIKMALLDPNLFIDHNHVARQVVNNIARLEFYNQESTNFKQNAISAAIENLLEKAVTESVDGEKIFEEILTKLNKLIKIQNKAYEDNVRDLIEECDKSPPEPELFEENAESNFTISAAEMHKWLQHVRRLHKDDNVLLCHPGNDPLRLRVGWIDENKSIYVFVNLRGIKESVLKAADVATMIRLGILKPQVNAEDSAMDRAQYVIMQELYQQVLHESTHDSVTGLINRREFNRHMREVITSAKRDDTCHALLYIDIDKFSAINNNCGYAGGDLLLIDVVKILQSDLPANTILSRLGSDQFGILLKDSSLNDARVIAEQKITEIARHRMEWKGEVYPVTLSMGLVAIMSSSGDEDELFKAAESSCDIAKDNGGNRLQVFQAGRSRFAHQADVVKWVGKIETMLEQDALEIRCQLIQPLAKDSDKRPHYEILMGVRDEHGKVGSPSEFIKAAECYRRMSAVDRHVITRIFMWIESNYGVMENIDGFSINLSGQSINEEGFVDYILDKLKAMSMSVPREKICFEVTETVGVTSLSNAALFIERIKEEGCRFALDDFGSGMSSYSYLKNLPVDSVKIDGAFVKNMVAGSSDYAVVKSITEIAHFMKKEVVAEFVESTEVMELLREIGVDYVQGYMIDRPDCIDRLMSVGTLH